MLNKVGTVTRQHINDRNLYHCVASGLQTHRGTSNVYQNLTSECRVVNAHVEFQTLVLSLTAHTLAYQGVEFYSKQDPQALALVSEVMGQLTLDGFTRASYLLAYDEIRNYLTDLKVHCVVIAGDKDEITPAQAIMELAMEMKLSRCHLITDAGHLSYVDQPDQFNDIVLSAN